MEKGQPVKITKLIQLTTNGGEKYYIGFTVNKKPAELRAVHI